ncbi:MAG: Gfo/Idh/MocA family protein [Nitrospinota bacterium]
MAPASEPLGMGIVGLGIWAEMVTAGIEVCPQTRLLACTTRSAEKRRAFAQRHRCEECESFESLLAHPGVEAVAIVSASQAHYGHAMAALTAGKHVFLEKPMANTLPEARAIVERAREKRKVLQIGFETRLIAPIARMREMLRAGELGKPVQAEANFSHNLGLALTPERWHYYEANCPGGPLMQLGIHQVHNLNLLLGPPLRVRAMGKRLLIGAEVPDLTGCLIEHESGAVSYVGCYYVCPRILYLNLYATGGNLFADVRLSQGPLPDYLRAFSEADRHATLHFQPKDSLERKAVPLTPGDPMAAQMAEFARSVREGAPSEADGERGFEALAVVLAAVESMKTGRAVELSEFIERKGGLPPS